MDTAERLLKDLEDLFYGESPMGRIAFKPQYERLKRVLSSSESKESAAGAATGSEMVGQPIQAERPLLPTLTDAEPVREQPLPPPAPTVPEEPNPDDSKYRHQFTAYVGALRDYARELRSLLAQREEEITNLQAEAFDWRMRAEAAERGREGKKGKI